MPVIKLNPRKRTGYFFRDERASGGIVTEADTYTCSHCQGIVMINPLRERERPYCEKCDHHLCDRCGAVRAVNGGECKTVNQVIEEIQEQAARSSPRPYQPLIIAQR